MTKEEAKAVDLLVSILRADIAAGFRRADPVVINALDTAEAACAKAGITRIDKEY